MSERRDAIVRVASEIFAQKGYRGTTVREIADEAGILSGSLYHHFSSKEDLAFEVLAGYYNDLLAQFRKAVAQQEDPTSLLSELISISCRGIADYPAAVALIQRSGDHLLRLERFAELAKANDEMRNIWLRAVRAGIREGIWTEDVDPNLVFRSMRDVLSGAANWWKPGGRYRIEQLAEMYTKLFLFGMVGPSPRTGSRARYPLPA
jgi:AcrR family transcriptional regulator